MLFNMAAPKAKYQQDDVLEKYIEDTFKEKNPYQAKIDTICQKILDCYFTSADKFMTETQAYPNSNKSLSRTNVDVITMDGDELRKVLVLEAKRFPPYRAKNWENKLDLMAWKRPMEQLEEYMLTVRDKDKWAHMMYGIVAVGDRVHFLKLHPNSHTLKEYVSSKLSSEAQQMTTFSIRKDPLLIETVLSGIDDDIKRKRT